MCSGSGGGQFHWAPATYLDLVRAEVPAYDELQDAVADATRGRQVARILDLGTGTGQTAAHVLAVHPTASLIAIDESAEMIAVAAAGLPGADVRLGRLQDPLPSGPFDLVVSALAVHHLAPIAKAELFRRVADALEPSGRFVLADVVVPTDPSDAITPLEPGVDMPNSVDHQLAWLTEAGLVPEVVWRHRDLAVFTADLPDR